MMATVNQIMLSEAAESMKSAIKMAWEHGGADFQSRFDKSTAQAEQMRAHQHI
jgi:hypothetical protein